MVPFYAPRPRPASGSPLDIESARRLIARFVEHDNAICLHFAIGYITVLPIQGVSCSLTWAEGNPRQSSEGCLYFCDRDGEHFPKIQTGSLFLGARWLDTALDFLHRRPLPIQSSVKPEHSRTPSLPQNVLGNCGG
jgi:hypothetical protein